MPTKSSPIDALIALIGTVVAHTPKGVQTEILTAAEALFSKAVEPHASSKTARLFTKAQDTAINALAAGGGDADSVEALAGSYCDHVAQAFTNAVTAARNFTPYQVAVAIAERGGNQQAIDDAHAARKVHHEARDQAFQAAFDAILGGG